MTILEVKRLSVTYGSEEVLRDISFSLEKGETLAIIGPNGSGKTTLFKAILGAIDYQGEITIKPGTRLGYVPQKLDLERNLPITVREFLLLKKGPNSAEVYSLNEVLKFVQLPTSFANKKFSELSAGELQRVMIAWALIDHPDLLLFDEPTASIDIVGGETIYELLNNLRRQTGFTLLIISHDLSVIYHYATKVLCLNKSQVCFGLPQEVLTPEGLQKLYGRHKIYTHPH